MGEPRLSSILRIEADAARVAIPPRRRSGMRALRFAKAPQAAVEPGGSRRSGQKARRAARLRAQRAALAAAVAR